jgi:hypothetical protein
VTQVEEFKNSPLHDLYLQKLKDRVQTGTKTLIQASVGSFEEFTNIERLKGAISEVEEFSNSVFEVLVSDIQSLIEDKLQD